MVALVFVGSLLVGSFTTVAPANAASSVGLFTETMKPKTAAVTSARSINLGMNFTTSNDGTLTALQFYRSSAQKKAYTASLWTASGELLARTTFAQSTKAGWQTAKLSKPVTIKKRVRYTASYLASDGRYAQTRGGFAKSYTKNGITIAKSGGVYTYSEKNARPTTKSARNTNFLVDIVFTAGVAAPTPTPTATAPSTGGWPSTDNTGVPAGTTLTAYTGPSTITADGTVIRNKTVNGNLNIQASNVQIVNSRINGSITLRSPKSNDYSFVITDSEVHNPRQTGTGIMTGNFRATRVEVTGGNRSMYCEYNCVVEDSLVHKQGADVGGDAHFSGIRMEQNGTFRHNTLVCEAGRGPGTGCSAALTGYGDFAPVQNNLIENNIFIGSRGGGATMCTYGGSSGEAGGKPYGHLARDIRFINNVFTRGTSGKCGNLGAVAHFNPSRPGNVWTGNTWDDGTTIGYNA